MKKTVIYYGVEGEALDTLKKVARDCEVLTPSTELIHERVGTILGEEGFSKENLPERPLPEMEFLLFCHLEREELYELLSALKKEGYAYPFKAVLTDTTITWPFSYLLEHIVAEHETVTAYRRLGATVKIAENKYKESQSETLKKLISEARDLPKLGEELTPLIIDDVHRRLKEALK